MSERDILVEQQMEAERLKAEEAQRAAVLGKLMLDSWAEVNRDTRSN